MNAISELLIKRVQQYGWITVGNIMFKEGVPVFNPATTSGNICISKSADMMFSTSRMDTHNTYTIEESYLVQDDSHVGLQQTIAVAPLDELHHFDVMLFSQWFRTTVDGNEYVVPKYPDPAMIEGLVPDEETGLFAEGDTITTIRDREESAISIYPNDRNVIDYTGIWIKGYQRFIKNQKMFCKMVNEMFGLSDCM